MRINKEKKVESWCVYVALPDSAPELQELPWGKVWMGFGSVWRACVVVGGRVPLLAGLKRSISPLRVFNTVEYHKSTVTSYPHGDHFTQQSNVSLALGVVPRARCSETAPCSLRVGQLVTNPLNIAQQLLTERRISVVSSVFTQSGSKVTTWRDSEADYRKWSVLNDLLQEYLL
jgi:hypothetical protein